MLRCGLLSKGIRAADKLNISQQQFALTVVSPYFNDLSYTCFKHRYAFHSAPKNHVQFVHQCLFSVFSYRPEDGCSHSSGLVLA